MARTLAGQSLVLRSVCLALVGAAFLPAPARALTPKSPEVKASVARACAYLAASTSTEGRHGGKALVGLVFLKAEQPNHARVQEAVAAVYDALKSDNPGNVEYVYATGLMLIFLTELPPEQHVQHAEAINTLVGRLQACQKAHGGWGYLARDTGDTSMTQYGILGYWSAEAAGFETPLDSWEKGANWLMRTQDPDGAHGYQGNDPGGFIPIEQATTTESICAAGAGSLYMCADYFGLLDDKLGKGGAADDADNPLKRVKKPGVGRKGKETTQVDPSMLWQRMEKANGHMDKIFTVDPQQHPYYYLYAYERYRTFRDYVDGNIEKEMPWYTDAAKSLFKLQDADGHWQTRNQEGNVCDTCFATLFLLRSMYKKV
ncbi:MAG TPA: hypothetical protein VND64_16205, partial [Pirellulales bacterium]|nr:hypothetical protein [Pirellulales bacterium]